MKSLFLGIVFSVVLCAESFATDCAVQLQRQRVVVPHVQQQVVVQRFVEVPTVQFVEVVEYQRVQKVQNVQNRGRGRSVSVQRSRVR